MTGKCSTPQKKGFPTKAKALAAAVTIRREGGPRMRAYRCVCGRFHLTTST